MKKFKFKSLYHRLAVTFIGIWWLINWFSFGFVVRVFSQHQLSELSDTFPNFREQFEDLRFLTLGIMVAGIVIGSLAILLSSRSIVKPIKELSKAARSITEGNFKVKLDVDGRDEIAQLAYDFNQMTKAIESTEALRKEFISNVSHEFKTPSTSIKGFANLIKQGGLSEDQVQDYCDIIMEESDRLNSLARDLLMLSEYETEVIFEDQKSFDLAEQIRRVVLTLEPQWQKKNIEIKLDLQSCKVHTNDKALHQVWINLINNAIKFSNENSRIEVTLIQEQSQVRVKIRDFGIGIDPEEIARIFERFYQAELSRHQEGHGLGLVVAKTIVDKMKGEIKVESKKNEGSTFIITLPT
jgi:signal transduction histidine kinase